LIDAETREPISKYHVCVFCYPTSSGVREKFSLQRGITEFDYEKDIYEVYVGEGETFGFDFLAEGYLPKHLTVVSSESGNTGEIRVIEVPLEKGGVLSGTVLDALSDSPVPNAKIQIYGGGFLNKKPIRPFSKARITVTGEDGSFNIDGLAKGRFFFKVTAPGYAVTLVDSCELGAHLGATSNIVKVWPGGVLRGTVLDLEGNALEEALVQVVQPGTEEVIVAKTNPDGTYIATGLPAGELEVLVEDYFERLTRGAWMKLRKVVNMPPGGMKTADFSFAGSCTIQGTCSYDGKPGWGVALEIIDSTGKTICTAHSSVDGFYRIFGIPAGIYSLEARSTLAATGGFFQRTLDLSEGEDLKLDIDLANKAVYGQVKDSNGTPIHGAVVELMAFTFDRSHTTFTDQEGNYTILCVEEGTYSIAARADDLAEEISGPWPLGGTHPVKKVDFGLKAGGIGRVEVTDGEGNPVPGAMVHISDDVSKGSLQSDVAGYSGVCVFENLGPEALYVIAGGAGFAPGGARLSAAAGEITTCAVELSPGGDILIEVRNREGFPVSGAYVTALGFSLFGLDASALAGMGLLSASNQSFLTDEKGTFTLGPLPLGLLSVKVNKGVHSGTAEVSIAAGEMNTISVVLQ